MADPRKRLSDEHKGITSMLRNARRRAEWAGVPFNLVRNDIVIPVLCPALGFPVKWGVGTGHGPNDASPSLDRIDPDLGYVPGNVVIVSNRANRIKSDATVEELEEVATFYRSLREETRLRLGKRRAPAGADAHP